MVANKGPAGRGGGYVSPSVTDDDVKVLYRIAMHRNVIVKLLREQEGVNSHDADLYDRVMGQLQHAMDKMGLTTL